MTKEEFLTLPEVKAWRNRAYQVGHAAGQLQALKEQAPNETQRRAVDRQLQVNNQTMKNMDREWGQLKLRFLGDEADAILAQKSTLAQLLSVLPKKMDWNDFSDALMDAAKDEATKTTVMHAVVGVVQNRLPRGKKPTQVYFQFIGADGNKHYVGMYPNGKLPISSYLLSTLSVELDAEGFVLRVEEDRK